jgi:ABC-type antimicrobial peptide transport system permease subunit
LRHVVHWQATLIAAALLVVAVPVGMAAGRSLYRAFAEDIGARADVSVPFTWLGAALLGLIVLANIAAAVPARRAARLTPARVLNDD